MVDRKIGEVTVAMVDRKIGEVTVAISSLCFLSIALYNLNYLVASV